MEKLNNDIELLKQQRKILINKINKEQSDYNISHQKLEEMLLEKKLILNDKLTKMENDFMIKFNEKKTKLNKTLDKRNNRKNKLNKKKNKNNIGTQTITTKTYNSIEIQTEVFEEPKKEIDYTSYNHCSSIINNIFDNMFKQEMSIQCNLIEEHKIEAIKKTLNIPNSTIKNDFYILDYFKKIDPKKNKKQNKVSYINENLDIRFKRNMLGVLDTNNDIYNIQFSSVFTSNILINIYSENEYLFEIFYTFHPTKDNIFGIFSKKLGINVRKSINFPLKSKYNITLTNKNNDYKLFFNDKLIVPFSLKQYIKFFTSSANFNIIYN